MISPNMFDRLPIIRREQAKQELDCVLPLDSPKRVLLVQADGGLGKTWFLWGLQAVCDERNILRNRQLIDFYDTASQRISGLLHQIITRLDGKEEYFREFLELRKQFDTGWLEAEALASQSGSLKVANEKVRRQDELAPLLDKTFLKCLNELGHAYRKDGQRGIVLFFDTYEMVREGRVGRWFVDDLLKATNDIVIVVASRPPGSVADRFGEADVHRVDPGGFTEMEIVEYLRRRLRVPPGGEILELTDDNIRRLAHLIYQNSQGLPVLVALAFDIITLGLPLSFATARAKLEKAAKASSFQEGLIEQFLDILGDMQLGRAYHQWAVLYMALFRRRFNQDVYDFLIDKTNDERSLNLSAFEDLHVVKSRMFRSTRNAELSSVMESSVLLHDIIGDAIREKYWRGSIPRRIIEQGIQENLFPKALNDIWDDVLNNSKHENIGANEFSTVLEWLNRRNSEYYETEQLGLRKRQKQSIDNPDIWQSYEVRCQAQSAEQFLYGLDLDLNQGWATLRRAYDEAFEAGRHGYCEQLELTVLGALGDRETANDARKAEIKNLMRVRQRWWDIRRGPNDREEAIEYLLREADRSPNLGKEHIADIRSSLGWAYDLNSDLGKAIEHRRAAAELYDQVGLARERERSLNFLGESYAQRGHFKLADDCWEEASRIAQAQTPRDNAEIASVSMKRAYYKGVVGELSPAIAYIKLAENLFSQVADPRRLGKSLAYQGRIYLANVRLNHARRALDDAEQLLGRVGDERDEVLWKIARGEFYRRKAVEGVLTLHQARFEAERQYAIAEIEDSFARAEKDLEDVLQTARADGLKLQHIEALGEHGTLLRDRARYWAEQGHLEKAMNAWQKAKEELQEAHADAQEVGASFLVADMLDDLCDLFSDQHRLAPTLISVTDANSKTPQELLNAHLSELARVAEINGYDRFLSRVAEKRAKLSHEAGRYAEAIEYSVVACKAVGLHTHSGHMFRDSYDKLVGDLEQRLADLPTDELRVQLSQRAMASWGRMYAGKHPQLVIACERVLHPAEARLEESGADAAFAVSNYEGAFRKYVEACHHSALRANDTYANYEIYAKLVAKLERRLYDLESPEDVQKYCDFIEEAWLEYRHAIEHPTVIEICVRAREMSQLMLSSPANVAA